MKYLSLEDIERVAFQLAQQTMAWSEPIPNFNTRFKDKLEGCLAATRQSFYGQQLYKGLTNKAAIQFYLMIKNHPFQNGNKRIAMTVLLVFLYKNAKWLKVEINSFYDFTMRIAASPAEDKKQYMEIINNFISRNLADLSI